MKATFILLLAILCPILMAEDYTYANWDPAYSGNYTVGRGGNSVKYVIVHVIQGSYSGCISWFKNPSAKVSAHYVVSKGGSVTQMVKESDTGWHAGNWTYNQKSIGIEHEGYVTDPSFPDSMYISAAALVRDICNRHGIPKDRSHIIGHIEVPGATHTDPGANWNWTKFMTYVNSREPFSPDTLPKYEDTPTEEYRVNLTGIQYNVEKLQKSLMQRDGSETITIGNILEDASLLKVKSICSEFPTNWTANISINYEAREGTADLVYLYDRYDCEVWMRTLQGEWQKLTNTSAYAFKGYRVEYRK